MRKTIYQRNFQLLNRLFEGKFLSFITLLEHQQLFITVDNRELVVDVLNRDEFGNIIIYLTQYIKQDGMLIIDPEMKIQIGPSKETAEVLSYQASYSYINTYTENGEPIPVFTKDLSIRLESWLKKIIKMNYKPIEKEQD